MALTARAAAGALEPHELARLNALLKAQGYNKNSFAREIGRSGPYIRRLLTGEEGATLRQWRDICKELGVHLSYLFQEGDVPPLPADPLIIARMMEGQLKALQEALLARQQSEAVHQQSAEVIVPDAPQPPARPATGSGRAPRRRPGKAT